MTAVRRLKPAYGAAGPVAGHKLTGLARRSIRRRLGNLPERGRYVTTWRSVFQHLVSPLSGRNLYGDYGGQHQSMSDAAIHSGGEAESRP